MYKDEIIENLSIFQNYGDGFTYYDNLDNYNSIDRTDIKKIENNFLITLYMDRYTFEYIF